MYPTCIPGQRERWPHRGFQFYLLMTTVSPSTRAHSEMHSVFVMAGHCHRPLLSAQLWLSLLSQLCNDLPKGRLPNNKATWPDCFTFHQSLPQYPGESLSHCSTITTDNARLDICARGFWSAAQDSYFYVRVFHPNAPRNSSRTIKATYKKHEDEKKTGLQPTRQRHWARSFHPPRLLNHRWTGARGHHLLQKTSRHACLERRKKLLSSKQLVKVQAILCCHPIINYVHPTDKIINSSTPTWRWHHSCYRRGPDPSFN